jgi:hypothetical protein
MEDNKFFIESLFKTYVNREPTDNEYKLYLDKYQNGLNNDQITDLFKTSNAYLILLIDKTFIQYYSRSPSPTEQEIYLAKLKEGQLNSIPMINEIRNSGEAIIVNLYKLYLGRIPNSTELTEIQSKYNSILNDQQQLNTQLTSDIKSTTEYFEHIVVRLYEKYLERTPSDKEITNWTQTLVNSNEQNVLLSIKNSEEYKQKNDINNKFGIENEPDANSVDYYQNLLELSDQKMTQYADELQRQGDLLGEFKTHQDNVIANNGINESYTFTRPDYGKDVPVVTLPFGHLDWNNYTCPAGYAYQQLGWRTENINGHNYIVPAVKCSKFANDGSTTEGFINTPLVNPIRDSNYETFEFLMDKIKSKIKQFGDVVVRKYQTYNTIYEQYQTYTNKEGTTRIDLMLDGLQTKTKNLKIDSSNVKQLRDFSAKLQNITQMSTGTGKYLYSLGLKLGQLGLSKIQLNIILNSLPIKMRISNFADLRDVKEKGFGINSNNLYGYIYDRLDSNKPREWLIVNNEGKISETPSNNIWIVSNYDLRIEDFEFITPKKNIGINLRFDFGDSNIYNVVKKVKNQVVDSIEDYNQIKVSIEKIEQPNQLVEIEGFSVKYEKLKEQLVKLFGYIDQLVYENDQILADISVEDKKLLEVSEKKFDPETDCYKETGGLDWSIDVALSAVDSFQAKCKSGYIMTDYDIYRNGNGRYDIRWKCCENQ